MLTLEGVVVKRWTLDSLLAVWRLLSCSALLWNGYCFALLWLLRCSRCSRCVWAWPAMQAPLVQAAMLLTSHALCVPLASPPPVPAWARGGGLLRCAGAHVPARDGSGTARRGASRTDVMLCLRCDGYVATRKLDLAGTCSGAVPQWVGAGGPTPRMRGRGRLFPSLPEAWGRTGGWGSPGVRGREVLCFELS